MKKLLALMLLGSLAMFQQAHASGCGGPEYYLETSKVLQSLPFAEAIENYEIGLFTSKDRRSQRLELHFFSKKMSVPGSPHFNWHMATPEGGLPAYVTFQELENLLQQSTVEIVEDKYIIDCGVADKDTENNFRIRLNYNGQSLVLRTNYAPEAAPW
ncbi:hypothetical protein [Bdellovibrio bacteriovorus]|uniref:hypothetical protein n=1 Tax=Bdellovibrio TaxID=958 RepID=UPI0035A81A1D